MLVSGFLKISTFSNLSHSEILFPLFFAHLFDGITEHGPGHFRSILIQESTEFVHAAAFSDFTEHPANRFMDEIVLMREHPLCDIDRQFSISLLYLMKGSEDDDTIDPDIGAGNTLRDEIHALFVREVMLDIGSDNVLARDIDQVPIIDSIHVLHIKLR